MSPHLHFLWFLIAFLSFSTLLSRLPNSRQSSPPSSSSFLQYILMSTSSSSPSYPLEYMDLKYDVASFFLVESSGDSEGDFGFSSFNDVQDEEDDAESCCWGSSSDVDCMENYSVGVDADQDYSSEEHAEHNCDDKDYHHRCKLRDGRWISEQEMRLMDDGSSSDESMQSEEKKQRKIEEEVSEEEKNRMFWDNCLAL